jgi:hypothetical protein
MTSLIALIDQTAIGIYFLILAGILYSLYRFLAWRTEYRATYFELERDLSRYRQMNAITAVVILIEIAVIIAGIQLVVVPELQADQDIEALVVAVRENDGVFETPIPATPSGNLGIEPVEQIVAADFSGQVQATPTLTPTPVGTIIPADPVIGCDNPEAQLFIPANGMRVFQPIPVIGTAYTDQFAYAKIEINGPSTFGNFQVIEDKSIEVRERSEISQFVPAGYAEGEYELRLMVFDVTNTLKAACLVHIYISEPFPTATPPGGDT